mmetsp:Transcript_73452/g.172572  ORF Transcript_73452/g.172572 Transcript_73452/m.172572 type:complete len:101 (+) Transcript_73452:307-609(+)
MRVILSGYRTCDDQRQGLRRAHFQCEEQQECFDTVEASVHKIAHEQVVRVWAFSTNFEKFLQVIELAVDVAANRDRGIHALDIALLEENLPSFCAKSLHF